MRSVVAVLSVLALCACKKQEAVQQVAPTETGPVVASTAPTASVVAIDSAAPIASSAPAASESAAPHAMSEAEKEAAKQKAIEQAREFGMIGIIGADDGGTVPWGRDDSVGNSFGPGGLGRSGGNIGLGNVGTFGHRDGGSTTTTTGAPTVRQGTTTVNGRLPPEVIQRIVRQNFGRYKLCYTSGLRSNPSLQGRVVTKFVIDRDGSVKSAQDNGSDLPDQTVVQCVVRGFGNLSFPQPEGGIVTVVFPLIFSPGS